MEEGGDNNRDDNEKNNAAKQGIEAGKDLALIGLECRYRPHPGQDHRGVQKSINRTHILKVAIANHP